MGPISNPASHTVVEHPSERGAEPHKSHVSPAGVQTRSTAAHAPEDASASSEDGEVTTDSEPQAAPAQAALPAAGRPGSLGRAHAPESDSTVHALPVVVVRAVRGALEDTDARVRLAAVLCASRLSVSCMRGLSRVSFALDVLCQLFPIAHCQS